MSISSLVLLSIGPALIMMLIPSLCRGNATEDEVVISRLLAPAVIRYSFPHNLSGEGLEIDPSAIFADRVLNSIAILKGNEEYPIHVCIHGDKDLWFSFESVLDGSAEALVPIGFRETDLVNATTGVSTYSLNYFCITLMRILSLTRESWQKDDVSSLEFLNPDTVTVKWNEHTVLSPDEPLFEVVVRSFGNILIVSLTQNDTDNEVRYVGVLRKPLL